MVLVLLAQREPPDLPARPDLLDLVALSSGNHRMELRVQALRQFIVRVRLE